MLKEVGQIIGKGLSRVVFGPETRGYIQVLRRDCNNPVYYHILVKTDEGQLRHFTSSENQSSDNLVYRQGKLEFKTMTERAGDRWICRTRGTGVLLLPGSRLERNPFNL